MDRRVAVDAIRGRVEPSRRTEALVEPGNDYMTRVAQIPVCLILQQVAVRRAMGNVTGGTSLDAAALMLEYKGPPFVGVAPDARLVLEPSQPAACAWAVLFVTITARHHPLENAVSFIEAELGPHLGVAAKTGVGFGTGQQQVTARCFVDHVTRRTIDSPLHVRAGTIVEVRRLRHVAIKALPSTVGRAC